VEHLNVGAGEGSARVRVSISVTSYSWPSGPRGLGSELARVAAAADQGGLDTVWVADHLLQSDPTAAPGQTEMLEAYTTLGFLAGQTERVRLGTMVTGVTFRPPALLVKAVTTLDVLSGGRAWLGIGAGYQQDEARALRLPLPPVAERFQRLEETLQIASRMWAGDQAPFQGRHYRLQRPVGSPLPVRRPHPPVLVGGTGERKTLRLVARYADACNLFDIPDGGRTVKHKLEVLARHCEQVGRPYEAIEKTLSTRLEAGEPAEEFVGRCQAAAAWGIQHMVVIVAGPWTEAALATLAEAVPNLQETST
jgi:F420-dependent oxidoreductase-like protein